MPLNCSEALSCSFRPVLSPENVGYKQRLRLRSENPDLTSVGPSLRVYEIQHYKEIHLNCNSIRHLLLNKLKINVLQFNPQCT